MFVVEFIFQGVKDLQYFVNLEKRKFSHKIPKEYNTIHCKKETRNSDVCNGGANQTTWGSDNSYFHGVHVVWFCATVVNIGIWRFPTWLFLQCLILYFKFVSSQHTGSEVNLHYVNFLTIIDLFHKHLFMFYNQMIFFFSVCFYCCSYGDRLPDPTNNSVSRTGCRRAKVSC